MNKKRESSGLVYNNFNFKKFNITDEDFDQLSVDTKYKHLQKFFNKINELKKVKSRTDHTKKNIIVDDAASKLFNEYIGQLDDEYKKIIKCWKNEFGAKYNLSGLFLDAYDDIYE